MSKDIEEIARAIYAAAQDEARRTEPNAPLPSYDQDDEDARRFCRSMAQAAYSVMQSRIAELEDALGKIDQWCDERFSCGSSEAMDHVSAIVRKALNNESKPVENGRG